MKNPLLFEMDMMQMWMNLFLDELFDSVIEFSVDVQTLACKKLF